MIKLVLVLLLCVAARASFDDDTQAAINDRIVSMPSLDSTLACSPANLKTYSGYLQVRVSGSSLFYVLFDVSNKANNESASALLTWNNGGPGSSSMTGLFNENGPWRLRSDSALDQQEEVYCVENAWTDVASVLYIDQPIGTGFSTVATDGDYVSDERGVAVDYRNALLQFYERFPRFRRAPLLMTGESYAGRYVPAAAAHIVRQNDAGAERIPLAGIAVGDGIVSPIDQRAVFPEQGHGAYLVDAIQAAQATAIAHECQSLIAQQRYSEATDRCNDVVDFVLVAAGDPDVYRITTYEPPYPKALEAAYLSRADVQQAMHARPGPFSTSSSQVAHHMHSDISKSQLSDVEFLANHASKPRLLFYGGNEDLRDGPLGTELWLYELRWPGNERFYAADRQVFYLDGGQTVGGMDKRFDNVRFFTVMLAGHFVPRNRPAAALAMIATELAEAAPASARVATVLERLHVERRSVGNQLCDLLSNCSFPQGSCVAGQCVCASPYFGASCAHSVHSTIDAAAAGKSTIVDLTVQPFNVAYLRIDLAESSSSAAAITLSGTGAADLFELAVIDALPTPRMLEPTVLASARSADAVASLLHKSSSSSSIYVRIRPLALQPIVVGELDVSLPTSKSSPSSDNAAVAIVGIVVAMLVAIAIIVAIVFTVRRRRHNRPSEHHLHLAHDDGDQDLDSLVYGNDDESS
jgi:vitellogenic carboxypeptidase-like protein